MKYFKFLLELFLFGFIPGLLIFVGENDTLLQWFHKHDIISNENIKPFQTFSFITGLTFSALIFPIIHNKTKNNKENLEIKNNELLKEYKNKFIENLRTNLGQHNTVFNVRIFEQNKDVISFWNNFWHKRKYLVLKNFSGVTDDFPHKTLKFEVSKDKTQGVVGKSFKEKAIYIDTDLSNNHYELTEAHKIKIGEIEFCAAIPIFNNSENKIIKVLSIDSPNKINLNEQQKKIFEKQIILLAAFVDKYLK